MANSSKQSKFESLRWSSSNNFGVFDSVSKQAYKLKLLAKKKIYDVFYMLLLEQDITNKRQINKLLELELDLEEDNNYKIEAIRDNTVYNEAAKS